MGDDSGSRFFWKLIDTGRAECAVMYSYEFQGTGIYMSMLSGIPEDTEENLQDMLDTLRDTQRGGISSEELAQAQNKICSQVVLQSERPMNRLFMVGENWLQRRTYQSVPELVRAYQSVTLSAVADVLHKYPLATHSTVAVGPLRALPAPLSAAIARPGIRYCPHIRRSRSGPGASGRIGRAPAQFGWRSRTIDTPGRARPPNRRSFRRAPDSPLRKAPHASPSPAGYRYAPDADHNRCAHRRGRELATTRTTPPHQLDQSLLGVLVERRLSCLREPKQLGPTGSPCPRTSHAPDAPAGRLDHRTGLVLGKSIDDTPARRSPTRSTVTLAGPGCIATRILPRSDRRPTVMERTLVLLKPDCVQRRLMGRMIARFEDKGLNLIAMKMLRISPELARRHYAEHVDKPFYPGLERFITGCRWWP